MEFPSLDPNNNYIYVKFATIKSHALLLYNYDNQTGERAEFLALEIAEERLRFSYNLGSGTYKLTTMKKVSDGQFHTVIARRAGMVRLVLPSACCRCSAAVSHSSREAVEVTIKGQGVCLLGETVLLSQEKEG